MRDCLSTCSDLRGQRELVVGNSQGCCVGVRGCSEVLELSPGLACEKTGDLSLVWEGPDHRRLQVDEKLRLDLRGTGFLGMCTILVGCPGCVCLKFHVSCLPQRRWRGCRPWSPCHFYPGLLGRFLFSREAGLLVCSRWRLCFLSLGLFSFFDFQLDSLLGEKPSQIQG